jgi:hypothetical protein
MKWLYRPDLQCALREFNTDTLDWYGWINVEDGEVYSNVQVVKDGATMPTESEVNAKLTEIQAEYDAYYLDYKEARRVAYKPIEEQLDMMYKDELNGTTTWKDHIAQVKSDNPKPSE